jgi:hypothetical protein
MRRGAGPACAPSGRHRADRHERVVELVEQGDGLNRIEAVGLAVEEEAAEIIRQLDAQLARARRGGVAQRRRLGKQERVAEAADAHVLVGENADGRHLDFVAAPAIAQGFEFGCGFVSAHLAGENAGFETLEFGANGDRLGGVLRERDEIVIGGAGTIDD